MCQAIDNATYTMTIAHIHMSNVCVRIPALLCAQNAMHVYVMDFLSYFPIKEN